MNIDIQVYRGDTASPALPPSQNPVVPEVYYSDGRLVCGEDSSATQYLTSKLVADSLMWQQTFRNDSPSPVDSPSPNATTPTITSSSLPESMASLAIAKPAPVDVWVLGDIETEARRLATEVDNLVESLACILQGVSALTVDTVETYRYIALLFKREIEEEIPFNRG